MNWEQIEGQWKEVKSHIKTKWAKLTDDDLAMLSAKKDALVGRIQERYGILKEEAEKQVDEWIATLKSDQDKSESGKPKRRVG